MWKEHDNKSVCVYTSKSWSSNVKVSKIVAFDLDFTLVRPKRGRKFATDENDFEWMSIGVPTRLKATAKEKDTAVILFTNQGWKDAEKLEKMKRRAANVVESINLPCLVFISCKHDENRKPRPGMANLMKSYLSSSNVSKYLYVGDAAGRAGDHDYTDRTFAMNCGWDFQTPEEYFENKKPESYKLKLDLSSFPVTTSLPFSDSKGPEVVICVGRQGSGKTHYVAQHLLPKGYVHINQDTLRTKEKCRSELVKLLNTSKCPKAVIDNTNPSKEVREYYINIAKEANVPVRILYFEAPLVVCKHNNAFRAATDETRERVPDIAYRIYDKNFEEPGMDEGVANIVKIPFAPDGSVAEWNQYYV